MGILTLLCSSYLLKNSVYEWELLVLKQMQNTKWPEFFFCSFRRKGMEEYLQYTESHLSPLQREELLCIRLVSNQGFQVILCCLCSQQRGSRQFRSPMM